jgi:hypothetical protein
VSTYKSIRKRIAQNPTGDRAFELIVLTHVDADHVEGLVRLFSETSLPFTVNHVWFNGWRQMKKSHVLGPLQGEFLSALLDRRVLPGVWRADAPPWVVLGRGKLPTQKLAGGMKLTLLSPSIPKLASMAKAWESAIKKEGFTPGNLDAAWKVLAEKKKFLPEQGLLGVTPNLDELIEKQFAIDQAVANGSSIAFLAEYGAKSALFLADAHPDVVSKSLARLCKERGVKRLKVDAVKVAHHGSEHNTNKSLLQQLDSPRYLISTNGDHFQHPDKACIARILRFGKPKQLYFNYRSTFTEPWLTNTAGKRYQYEPIVRPETALKLDVIL